MSAYCYLLFVKLLLSILRVRYTLSAQSCEGCRVLGLIPQEVYLLLLAFVLRNTRRREDLAAYLDQYGVGSTSQARIPNAQSCL